MLRVLRFLAFGWYGGATASADGGAVCATPTLTPRVTATPTLEAC